MKRLIAILALLAVPALAQYTQVSGQIMDAAGNPYVNAQWTISLVNNTGSQQQVLLSGSPFQEQYGGFADGAGNFSVLIPDSNQITPTGTQWKFTFCQAGGVPQKCFSITLTITGASENITSQIQAAALPLNAFSGGTVFGGIQATGAITAKSIGGVQYASTLFSGADIGAEINAAIAAVGCGKVKVPAGSYSFATTIVKPRCVLLEGDSAAGTILTWTPTSGTAMAIGDSGSATAYAGGGVRDIRLVGPGKTTTAVGVEIGGDPNGVILPAGDFADFQAIDNLTVTAFHTGVLWGSNAYLNSFYHAMIHENAVGITEPAAAITNSGEQNAFYGGAIFNNTSGGVVNCNAEDLVFVGTSFDFNGDQASVAEIIASSLNCFNCHIENNSGTLINNSAAVSTVKLFGGWLALDGTAATTSLINIGGSGSVFSMTGTHLSTGGTVSELIDFTDSGNSWLYVTDLSGNGGANIASLFQAGFTPGRQSFVDAWTTGWPQASTHGNTTTFLGGIVANDVNDGNTAIKIHDTAAGDATPDKLLRINGGSLQIVNSGGSAVIWQLSDAGVITLDAPPALPSTYTVGANTITQPATTGTLALTGQLPLAGSLTASTTAVAANICADIVTATITGATTSMAVAYSFSGAPQAGLRPYVYISAANTVTQEYCNDTASSITPNAQTVQLRVIQ